MRERVRTAVIGLGAIGPTHAYWCASVPMSDLKVVCDIDEARAEQVARDCGCDAATDYRAVLARDDVDAIIIAAPTFLHAPIAVEAAQAGKHVAVEKPLATTLEQCDAMIEAVRAAGVKSQYFENLCFSPSYRQAKEIIDAGGLGDILFVRCCESAGGGTKAQREVYEMLQAGQEAGGEGSTFGTWYVEPEKSGGGALISAGCHAVMYVRYIFDRAPVTRVYAEMLNVVSPNSRVEDAAYVTMHHANGKVGFVDSSIVNALGTFDDRAEIYGTEGTIFLDIYRSSPIRVYSQRGYGEIGSSMFGSIPQRDINWSYPIPDERWALGYEGELRHFLTSIISDSVPEITFEDGRATLEIIMAAYKSGRTGNAVSLPVDSDRSDG